MCVEQQVYRLSLMHTNTPTPTPTHRHTQRHTRAHTRTHTSTNAQTHTLPKAHTHRHRHTRNINLFDMLIELDFHIFSHTGEVVTRVG